MRLVISFVLAVAVGGVASAASGPTDPTAELKSLTTLAGGDIRSALLGAEQDRVASNVFTPPVEPLTSVTKSICDRTLADIEQGYGRYVARHVREPTRGVPTALDRMDADFRRRVRTVSRTLPAKDPVYLAFGESLSRPPSTWEQAARQRAEWTSVLGTLRERLIAEAERSRKYEAYAAVGFWIRLDCLSARADAQFMRDFDAAGGQRSDARTAAAIEALEERAAQASR